MTQRRHNPKAYRSGLEKEVAAYLKPKQKKVRYEVLKVEWEDLKYRTYTPDFVLDNGIIVETKGIFDNADRQKHLAIKNAQPTPEIFTIPDKEQHELTEEYVKNIAHHHEYTTNELFEDTLEHLDEVDR